MIDLNLYQYYWMEADPSIFYGPANTVRMRRGNSSKLADQSFVINQSGSVWSANPADGSWQRYSLSGLVDNSANGGANEIAELRTALNAIAATELIVTYNNSFYVLSASTSNGSYGSITLSTSTIVPKAEVLDAYGEIF